MKHHRPLDCSVGLGSKHPRYPVAVLMTSSPSSLPSASDLCELHFPGLRLCLVSCAVRHCHVPCCLIQTPGSHYKTHASSSMWTASMSSQTHGLDIPACSPLLLLPVRSTLATSGHDHISPNPFWSSPFKLGPHLLSFP